MLLLEVYYYKKRLIRNRNIIRYKSHYLINLDSIDSFNDL
jgi:hypothetical protein